MGTYHAYRMRVLIIQIWARKNTQRQVYKESILHLNLTASYQDYAVVAKGFCLPVCFAHLSGVRDTQQTSE